MAELHTSFSGPLKKVPQVDQVIDKYITQSRGNYDEALVTDDRWEVFYQLSDMRTGLLGWYDFPKNAQVLELGCEFGALTGMLCDKAAHVTVVEHSMFRAHTTVKRWQDRDNLDVYVGSMFDIPFRRKFDVIVMVDSFAGLGNGSPEHAPYVEYLRFLKFKEDYAGVPDKGNLMVTFRGTGLGNLVSVRYSNIDTVYDITDCTHW